MDEPSMASKPNASGFAALAAAGFPDEAQLEDIDDGGGGGLMVRRPPCHPLTISLIAYYSVPDLEWERKEEGEEKGKACLR